MDGTDSDLRDHPAVVKIAAAHQQQGHELYDITTYAHRWRAFLCSCGTLVDMEAARQPGPCRPL